MERKIVCNCCGRTLPEGKDTQIVMEDYVTIDKTWGYFSRRDGVRQQMTVCEDCFEHWLSGFAVPPSAEEAAELL